MDEVLIITPDTKQQMQTVKGVLKALKVNFRSELKEKKTGNYNPEFVAEMQQARKDIKSGKGVSVAIEDLWK